MPFKNDPQILSPKHNEKALQYQVVIGESCAGTPTDSSEEAKIAAIICGMFLLSQNNVMATQPPENKQSMASTPEALIKILENASFLKPDAYDKKLRELRAKYCIFSDV